MDLVVPIDLPWVGDPFSGLFAPDGVACGLFVVAVAVAVAVVIVVVDLDLPSIAAGLTSSTVCGCVGFEFDFALPLIRF